MQVNADAKSNMRLVVVSPLPRVSVLLPFRDEEKTLKESLVSLVGQDYAGAVEILAVNDRSTDSSLEIVRTMMGLYAGIRLVETEDGGQENARNSAVSQAKGQVIVNFSAHAIAAKNFISVLVTKLTQYGEEVAGVGCKHIPPIDDSGFSKAFGKAIRSFFGGFSTTYYQPDTECFTQSVAFTAYRARVFRDVGLFDPKMICATDAEFNLRLIRAGYKLVYTPETAVYHHEVSSVLAFFQKMICYGQGRARATRKHSWSVRTIYGIPPIALLLVAFFGVGSLFEMRLFPALLGSIVTYASCCFLSAVGLVGHDGLKQFLRLTVAFPMIHIGYAIGFITAIIWPGLNNADNIFKST